MKPVAFMTFLLFPLVALAVEPRPGVLIENSYLGLRANSRGSVRTTDPATPASFPHRDLTSS